MAALAVEAVADVGVHGRDVPHLAVKFAAREGSHVDVAGLSHAV
jgi:hypothetical protein